MSSATSWLLAEADAGESMIFFRWKHDQSRSEAFSQTNLKQLTHTQRSPIIHESNSLWSIAKKKKKADLNSQRTAGIGLLGREYERTKLCTKYLKKQKCKSQRLARCYQE